ncbi:1,4-dihydroxy-2-naphthoate polyprenyltransferase, partial [Streptosporangium algeriense]
GSGRMLISTLNWPSSVAQSGWAIAALTLLATPLAVAPVRTVVQGATGRALIATLQQTGRFQLVFGLLFTAGLALHTL